MKIFVTGSKGQLGRAVEKWLCHHELVLTDVNDLDITNLDETIKLIQKTQPDVIINCAAFTAVDRCEIDADLAYKINAIGPRNLAIAANEIGCEIVHISTDYVFDGEGEKNADGSCRPYVEFDLPNPQSVYGKTKLAGENFIKDIAKKYYIIRTSWLYGDGHNFVRTMIKLGQELDEVKVVDDQLGSPTSTKELVYMIEALIGSQHYGLYHGTCEGECTWYGFTKEIFRLEGINTSVRPVTTAEFPRPAKRPHYSVLDNYMLKLTSLYQFKDWKEAIIEYLKNS